MSMLDSLFKQGFKAAKCKTLLKLTIPRIKLLRNRREIQIKQMRRDIAKLLENGQEATARIRVEHIIREEKMMAAQEIIELFCELIAVRLPIIETQRECPLDLKEAISSVCFAAPRCADLAELQQVQILFSSKYGKEFVSAATELMPDCGVNRQLIELLSVRAPPAEVKLKLLKEIAEEHELEWDPDASETELFKTHEDLLNGPNQFVSGSKVPLPEKKHDESLHSSAVEDLHEESDSDSGLDSLDLPEVPKVLLRPSPETGSAPEMVTPPCPAPPDSELHRQRSNSFVVNENITCEPYLGPESIKPDVVSVSSNSKREDKQFLPFIAPPSLSSTSFPARQSEPIPSLARTKSALTTASDTVDHESAPITSSFPVRQSSPIPSLGRTKSELNVDLQDVLAAAHAAADSAERAAAAARSAASLAQVRITELIKKRTDRASENDNNTLHNDSPDQSTTTERRHIDHQKSFGDTDIASYSLDPHQSHGYKEGLETLNPNSYDTPNVGYESPLSASDQVHKKSTHHQPQRLTSMEDDPYFSYPNLFTRQDSNLGSGSADNSRSSHEL